jgi:hypothetical protein
MWGALKLYRRGILRLSGLLVFTAIPAFVHAQDQIPIGFKVERYSQLWERNPFSLVTPAAPATQPSEFDKLFLVSWLKDGGKDVVFVQNSETNETQRITSEPNRSNLRLLEMHLNPNPQFVEVVISDGKQQGTLKFRVGTQPPAGQTASAAQVPNNTSADPGISHRVYPGVPRVHSEGSTTRAPRPPAIPRKHAGAEPALPSPGQN